MLEELTAEMDFINQMMGSKPKTAHQSVKLKYLKPLLAASSRLGRALAELFGLLVKVCIIHMIDIFKH